MEFCTYLEEQWLRGRFSLFKELRDCCMHESSRQHPFLMEPEAAPTLTRRVAELVREMLLLRNLEAGRIAGDNGVMHVFSYPAKRVVVEGGTRSIEEAIAVSAHMGLSYARMEVQDEPPYGWPVKLRQKLCPCNYCIKFGTCVRLVYALRTIDRMDGAGRRIPVSRCIGQKRAADGTEALGGRPRDIGPALSVG
jgi:hypothetical protein